MGEGSGGKLAGRTLSIPLPRVARNGPVPGWHTAGSALSGRMTFVRLWREGDLKPNAVICVLGVFENVKTYIEHIELSVNTCDQSATSPNQSLQLGARQVTELLATEKLLCSRPFRSIFGLSFRPTRSPRRPVLTMNDDRPSRPEVK